MTPARWHHIEALYNAAMELPADVRIPFLAEACGEDTDLRCEVESLLAQDSSKTGTLDRPAWAAVVTGANPTATVVGAGTQLGPYKIEAQLGKGGMGGVMSPRLNLGWATLARLVEDTCGTL